MSHPDFEGDEAFALKAFTDMLIEFLRAVAAQDISGRVDKVAIDFWDALHHLGRVEHERRSDLVDAAFRSAIVSASLRDRERYFPEESDHDYHFQEAITASAKVLAERISGVKVQATRAEQTVAIHMNDRQRALETLRARYLPSK